MITAAKARPPSGTVLKRQLGILANLSQETIAVADAMMTSVWLGTMASITGQQIPMHCAAW